MPKKITLSSKVVTQRVIEGLSGLDVITYKRVTTIKEYNGEELKTKSKDTRYIVSIIGCGDYNVTTYKRAKEVIARYGGLMK